VFIPQFPVFAVAAEPFLHVPVFGKRADVHAAARRTAGAEQVRI
jgi:hypothetical protein